MCRTGLQNLWVRFCEQVRRVGGGPDGPRVPPLQVSQGQSLLDPAHNGPGHTRAPVVIIIIIIIDLSISEATRVRRHDGG